MATRVATAQQHDRYGVTVLWSGRASHTTKMIIQGNLISYVDQIFIQWLFHLPRTFTPNTCCHQLIEAARYKSTAVASQIPRYVANRAHLGCLWWPRAQQTQAFQQFATAFRQGKRIPSEIVRRLSCINAHGAWTGY